MLVWFLAKNVSIILGLMYPAYQTFKAVDGKDKEAKGQLLRYWAVFATFTAIEFYTDMLVSWLPFYYELKMLILLYLSIPFTKGSSTVYEIHMKPWFRAHQTEIDEAIAQVKAAVLAHIITYRDRMASWAHQSTNNFLSEKLPTLLPLYTMAIALSTEMVRSMFAQKPSKTVSSPDVIKEIVSDKNTSLELSESPISDINSVVEALPIAESVDNQENVPPVGVPSRTTHASIAARPIATRSHNREVSAPVPKAKEPKRLAKAKQLSGTAVPVPRPLTTQIANKTTIQHTIIKRDISSYEDDSISGLKSSPSRKSNPKLTPISPMKRSVV